jgi:Zn-finger nucleic acid-binding protein
MPMKCPIDGSPLVMAERSGVEIDYCPQCRGVWLDRGELDKIIERSAAAAPPPPPPAARAPERQPERSPERSPVRSYEPRHDRDDDYRGKPKRRESFLSDLFDF